MIHAQFLLGRTGTAVAAHEAVTPQNGKTEIAGDMNPLLIDQVIMVTALSVAELCSTPLSLKLLTACLADFRWHKPNYSTTLTPSARTSNPRAFVVASPLDDCVAVIDHVSRRRGLRRDGLLAEQKEPARDHVVRAFWMVAEPPESSWIVTSAQVPLYSGLMI